MFIVAYLHEGFLIFGKCLCSYLTIARELYREIFDMMDPIFLREVACYSYKCGTIVGDDFCMPPHWQRIFSNYEVAKGSSHFSF